MQSQQDDSGRLLAYIRAEWLGLSDTWRPWGFWVREYAPVPDGADSVEYQAVPERVWFHDQAGFRRENVWKWMRFVAVQTLAPTVRATPRLPVASAAYAAYDESEDYYVEVLWAGRYGMGWRVAPGPDEQVTVKQELWIA